MKVFQLINDKNNPAANQFIIINGNATIFQSYESLIAKYQNGKVFLGPDWDYSKTTSKHLYIFLRDNTPYRVYSKKDILDYIANGTFVEVEKVEL